MAKSKLKTLISEYLDIKREDIEFIYPEDNEEEIQIVDTNSDRNVLCLEPSTDKFCCGILHLGETAWNNSINSLELEKKNELCVELFNQIQRMYASKNDSDDISEGLITWSHTEDNIFVQALLSEYNTEEMPWKLASKFFNKNSGNVVCYFTAKINFE